MSVFLLLRDMRFLSSSAALLLTLCLSASGSDSTQSNILGLFPHFGYSHFKVYQPILRRLAERGHHLTVVTHIKQAESHPNYEELLLSVESSTDVFNLEDHMPSRSLWVMFQEFYDLHLEGQKSCQLFYKSGFAEEILKRHAEKPYDLVIMEYFNTDCYMGVAYLLQVPIIGLSSCALMPWHYDRVALPDYPSYIQSEFIGFSEELSWQDRLINFITIRGNKLLYRVTEWRDNAVIKRFLGVNIDVRDVAKTTSLIFVNQHYSLSGSRPLPSQVKEIGGVHIAPNGEFNDRVPKEIEAFLSASNETVLLISFGSMLKSSTIERNKLRGILAALKELNFRVIWRWDDEKVPLVDKRFLFTKWVPQLALLCHPKVNIFWGHGGMLGVTEAVHCGKPLIVTPFYGDQFLNGKAVENRKIGLLLNYHEISKQRVLEALREIIRHRYATNAVALSKVFRNRERSPLSSAIWWIEHILSDAIATDLLRTKAVNRNWFTYHSLDSVSILLTGMAVCIVVCFLILRFLWRLLNRKEKIKHT